MASYRSSSLHNLFRRCVSCPDITPSCPKCKTNEVCSLVLPTCSACQATICVASPSVPSVTSLPVKTTSSSTNVAAIASGVAGGVFVVAVVTYCVWRFCIKPKRQKYQQENWAVDPQETLPAEKEFTMQRDARASTHTVASLASTVLTRASNIIQIAYIPGVTNRSAPSTPGLLVPPVPPIPIALSSNGSTPRYEQEHFFMPGDLRDSTYSGVSDRTSYARNSVASTIYGKNAIVSPIPAQTVIRAKAAVVSVRSNGGSTPGDVTPPVPHVDYDKYADNGLPSPAFSVGSTFLNSATAATQVRPQVVRVESLRKKAASPSSFSSGALSSRGSLTRDSSTLIDIDDSPRAAFSPFSDPRSARHESSTSLSAVIEEATKRAHGDVRVGLGRKREVTPFGDEHALQE